jgi:cell division protein FtsL
MAADPAVAPRSRPHAPTRPRLRPAPPPRRRVSGPARGRRRARPAPTTPLGRLLEGVRTVSDSPVLDRLIRGQGWVVLLGVALIGIVFLQVSLLKLNTGIGQSIEKSAALERQNADLRAEVSNLSSEERIQSVAERQGLLMPDAGDVRYLTVRGAEDAVKAASVMRAPDTTDDAASTSATGTPTTPAPDATTTDPAATGTAPAPETTDPQTTAPPAEPQTTAPAPAAATPTAPTSEGATDAGAVAAPTTPGQ